MKLSSHCFFDLRFTSKNGYRFLMKCGLSLKRGFGGWCGRGFGGCGGYGGVGRFDGLGWFSGFGGFNGLGGIGGLGWFGVFDGFSGFMVDSADSADSADSTDSLQWLARYLRLTLVFKWYSAQSFLLVLTKLSFWRGDWAPSYNSMEFTHFLDIS